VFTFRGKLYQLNGKQFMSDVKYRLIGEAPTDLWGELIPVEHERLSDGGDYMVKLEDNRKVQCNLRRHSNLGASGVPVRFVYRFTATAPVA